MRVLFRPSAVFLFRVGDRVRSPGLALFCCSIWISIRVKVKVKVKVKITA